MNGVAGCAWISMSDGMMMIDCDVIAMSDGMIDYDVGWYD